MLPVSESLVSILPADQKNIWKNELQMWAARSMLLFQELLSITSDLNQINISPLAIKGPVLAFQLFGKINGRYYSDLDLVVKRNEIPNSIKVLLSRGYQLQDEVVNLDIIDWDKYLNTRNYIGLFHHEKKVFIELHSGVYAFGWLKAEDESLLIDDQITIEIHGFQFQTLNHENNFLYLCYHGAKHMYFRLSWLRDVAEVMAKWQIKHSKVLKMANDLKIEKLLGISLLLTREFFDTPIPMEYNSLQLDSLYYMYAVKINTNIIKGPAGIIPFSNINTNYNKEKIKGISKFSVHHVFLILIYKIFFRKGFLIRLKHYLLTSFKGDK